MSTYVVCDGCGKTLSTPQQIVIKGERVNGMVSGYPLPDHGFDW